MAMLLMSSFVIHASQSEPNGGGRHTGGDPTYLNFYYE